MTLTGETEAYPSATVFTKNLTWTDLASNQRLCGERPATLKTWITLLYQNAVRTAQ